MSATASLEEIVADYIAHVRTRACEHLSFYASQPSLAHALEVVATWRGPDGRFEAHQQKLPRAAKEASRARILELAVGNATTFFEIHRRTEDALGEIDGIGPREVYDVSLRLGAVLGLPPDQVYLHEASSEAARALGLDADRPALPVSSFPTEMRRLYAWEIENLLCLYRAVLCGASGRGWRAA